MRINRFCCLTAVPFLFISAHLTLLAVEGDGRGNGCRAESAGNLPAWTVEQVVHWLPPDTETISVVRGPFKVEARVDKDEDAGNVPLGKILEALALGPVMYKDRGRVQRKELVG